jgi:hypothetical protein
VAIRFQIIIFFILTFFPFFIRAQVEARLLSQSSSGQTSAFNVGTLDKIFEGDEVVILKSIHELEEKKLRVVPVAKGRCIKSTTAGSIWILYKIFSPELFVAGDAFLLMTDSNLLKAQRDPDLGRTTIVSDKKDLSSNIKSYLSGDQDRLSKKKMEYVSVEKTKSTKKIGDDDVKLIDADEWKAEKKSRYRGAIYKSASDEKFKQSYRLEKFHQLVTDYLNRVNHPDFNYDQFFADQMRDGSSNEFRKKGNMESEYEKFLYEKSLKSGQEKKFYQSVLNKGEAWSEDFSDEELRIMLGNVSVMNEKERRVEVPSKPYRYSFFFDYGHIVSNAQNDESQTYRRESLRSLGVELEATPFLKHKELERFTLFLNPQLTQSAFQLDQVNLNFDSYSTLLGIHWYAVNPPYRIYAPILFFGAFTRFGYSVVESPETTDSAKYTVFSFPGLQIGARINLKNRLGLRIVGSMESLKLERYEVNKADSFLTQNLDLVESKIALGLSYSF